MVHAMKVRHPMPQPTWVSPVLLGFRRPHHPKEDYANPRRVMSSMKDVLLL